MKYIPEQGDIIWLDFDPSSGREIMKRRPAFVISRKTFNAHTGFAIIAPITSTLRGIKLEVVLSKTKTKGAVLVHQMKSLDFAQRNAKFIETASAAITEAVSVIAQTIVR